MELQHFFIAGGLPAQGLDTEVLQVSQSGETRIQRYKKNWQGVGGGRFL